MDETIHQLVECQRLEFCEGLVVVQALELLSNL